MPETPPDEHLLGIKMSKSRGREEKQRQKKAERRKKKEEKTWKYEKKTQICVFLAIFTFKIGENEIFG